MLSRLTGRLRNLYKLSRQAWQQQRERGNGTQRPASPEMTNESGFHNNSETNADVNDESLKRENERLRRELTEARRQLDDRYYRKCLCFILLSLSFFCILSPHAVYNASISYCLVENTVRNDERNLWE